MQTYYRVLTTPLAVQRWRDRQYHSFHHLTPDEWWMIRKETGSNRPEDYPVITSAGVFTERARAEFVRLVNKVEAGGKFTDDEQRLVGELEGVCAFTSPAAAYKWGADGPHGHPTSFVTFTGIYLSKAPEEEGVVVKVAVTDGEIMTPPEFETRYLQHAPSRTAAPQPASAANVTQSTAGLPSGYRQAFVTAATFLLGFTLAFAKYWSFDKGEWSAVDAGPGVPLVIGIGLLLFSLFRALDVRDEEPDRYSATRHYLMFGILLVVVAVIIEAW